MKRKEITDLHHASKAELMKKVAELRGKITAIALERKTKPAKNFRQVERMRDDIARMLTIVQLLTQKEKTKV